MANTSYIKKVIEPHLRKWLSSEFPGHYFRERSLALRSGGSFAFDAVSDDAEIIAEFLCSRARTSGGNENTGGVRKAHRDIQWLRELGGEPTRVMVFTDEAFRDLIVRRASRLGEIGIQMVVCHLPASLRRGLDDVLDDASREMDRA